MNKENIEPFEKIKTPEKKKRQHLQFSGELVGHVAIDHPDKWIHSDEKDKLFKEQRNIPDDNYKRPEGGLRICEMCKNVYELH